MGQVSRFHVEVDFSGEPLFADFAEEGGDEAEQRRFVWKEGGDASSASEFLINAFDGVACAHAALVCGGKGEDGEALGDISLCKILNQFGSPYAVLHDSDHPTYQKDGKEHKNPAWAHNESIANEVAKASGPTRLMVSIPNFEGAYLGKEIQTDKPYNILCRLKSDSDTFAIISSLLDSLIDFTKPAVKGSVEWRGIEELKQAIDMK